MALSIDELVDVVKPYMYNSYYDLSQPIKDIGAGNLLKEVEQALFSYKTIDRTFEGYQFRVKKLDAVKRKMKIFIPLDEPAYYCFDDLIAFRRITDQTLPMVKNEKVTMRPVSNNGYRAIHYYYLKHKYCYPVEIQVMTEHDAVYNDWDTKYIYHRYDRVGETLRNMYEQGKIKTEYDFTNALTYLLSNTK